MKHKKILFVDTDPGLSGATVSMIYLIGAFKSQGFEVYTVTRKIGDDLKKIYEAGAKIITLRYNLYLNLHFTNTYSLFSFKGIYFLLDSAFRFVLGILFALRILSKIRPDLIYVNEYVYSQFSFSGRMLGIPSVTHIRSPFLSGSLGVRRKLFSRFLTYSNEKIFAITHLEANQIVDNIQKGKEKIIVIPEFLSREDFGEINGAGEIKRNLNLAENRKILVMMGGVEKVKGTYELIMATGLLKKEYSDFYLIIAGNIPQYKSNVEYKQKCLDYVQQNGLNDHVRFLPFVKDKNNLFEIADVVVSSSIISHFSRPVIEAWARKKPVVVSRCPHSLEFVVDNVNGLMYEAYDIEELKNKLLKVFNDESLREKICREGYNTSLKYFDADLNSEKIVKECEILLR